MQFRGYRGGGAVVKNDERRVKRTSKTLFTFDRLHPVLTNGSRLTKHQVFFMHNPVGVNC